MRGAEKHSKFVFKSLLCSCALVAVFLLEYTAASNQKSPQESAPTYLGFDRNDYPGDVNLPALKQSFAFAGYWLNNPPGAKSNSWQGERAILRDAGFGFLVLFNGRASRELKRPADPAALAVLDAQSATQHARREGFSPGTVIFLDQEEGGRLLPEQKIYVFAWADQILSAGFRAGVYCSGIPVKEGRNESVTTADDIREHAGSRKILFFVYNDVCPPSPGCANSKNTPLPSASGIAFAEVWQFAQSPRRKDFARSCHNYGRDDNCYPSLGKSANMIYVDLDSATSADPSNGRP
jgi:hypothetical protein